MFKKVALVGATGLVGKEVLKLLEKRHFPLSQLVCLASSKSCSKKLMFRGEELSVECLSKNSFKGMDLAFFCVGGEISKEFIPYALKEKCIVIDSSSAFRQEKNVPLVIPEINKEALQHHQGIIASPNCTTSILLMPLHLLHKKFKIKRIVAATYQAASGGGIELMQKLTSESAEYLKTGKHCSNYPYAFNLFLHNSPLNEHGYSEEEVKMVEETRKILEDKKILITATCVRVPILRAHSIAANVEFVEKLPSLEEVKKLIQDAEGVEVMEDFKTNRFPTPFDASEQDKVFCGRLRIDRTQKNTLELWIVGDQLLKGASLNAVQIAEELEKLLAL